MVILKMFLRSFMKVHIYYQIANRFPKDHDKHCAEIAEVNHFSCLMTFQFRKENLKKCLLT